MCHLLVELHVSVSPILRRDALDVFMNLSSRCVIAAPLAVVLEGELIDMSWNVACDSGISGRSVAVSMGPLQCGILVFEPRSPKIRILFIDRKLQVLYLSREENGSDKSRDASTYHNDFHRPHLIDWSGCDVVWVLIEESWATAHLLLECVHGDGLSLENTYAVYYNSVLDLILSGL